MTRRQTESLRHRDDQNAVFGLNFEVLSDQMILVRLRSGFSIGWVALRRKPALFGFILAMIAAGCAQPPYAAESGSPCRDVDLSRVLDDRDQAEVTATFESLAQEHEPSGWPKGAESMRGRWADVPLAAVYATDEVEMAIRQTVEHEWGYEFHLITVESWPGVLEVRRATAPHENDVYIASARVGRFGDRQDRAEQLIRAFDRQMRAFGTKRGFQE